MMYPLVREFAADGIPGAISCRGLGLAHQTYYRWLRAPITDRQFAEAYLANALFDAHVDDPEFGYRFLVDQVRQHHDHGAVADRVVWRLCRDNGWWSVFGKPKQRKASKPGTPSHDELVRHDFTAADSYQFWLTDLTVHRTRQGKLYVRAITDVFSKLIIGWAMDERRKVRFVVGTIEMAVARRDGDVSGCILHSDRGSQFRARKVRRTLARHGMVASMGKVGAAGDNAAVESFFALLQKNALDRRHWATRDELRIDISI